MGEWPTQPAICDAQILANSVEVLSASGSSNTEGSWTELIASTAFNTKILMFLVSYNYYEFLFDIGIGSAGNELPIAENIAVGCSTTKGFSREIYFILPFDLPAGTRIVARCQRSISTQGDIYISLFAARTSTFFSDETIPSIIAAGAVAANSGLTAIDPGETADTKGNYTELIAATTKNTSSLIFMFGDRADTTQTTCFWAVDLAIGAEGSEIVIVADFIAAARSEHDTVHPRFSYPLPLSIPSGTRLAARAASDNTDANRYLDVGVILL